MRTFRLGLLLPILTALSLAVAGRAQTFHVTKRELVLPTNDLVHDPSSGRIYASVSSKTYDPLGNRIVVIDGATGAIAHSVLVGIEPGPLALSADGQVLWVGLTGSRTVRRLDLATLTPGIEFPLGIGTDGAMLAEDIEVQPGSHDVIAVSRSNSTLALPRHEGVAIYDNGIRRSRTTLRGTVANRIEFSASPGLLYGINNEVSSFEFSRIAVTQEGVTSLGSVRGLIPDFFADILFERGRLYATNGMVVDPQGPPVGPHRIGTFSAAGPVRPAADQGLVFIAEKAFSEGGRLAIFDDASFAEIDSVPLNLPTSLVVFGRMVRWGPLGLAVRMGRTRFASDRVLLLDVFEGPPPDEDVDGVSDAEDDCPGVPNPDQADADSDGLGDACDHFPDDPDNLAACLDTLDASQALARELEGRVARLNGELADALGRLDADRDGIPDTRDVCPVSRPNGRVDPDGCQPWQHSGLRSGR